MSPLIVQKDPDYSAKESAYKYQAEAFEAIKDLEYAAVFHEQGLGKTKIAIDISLHWLSKSVVDSVLVIAKKALVHNWHRELKMHSHLRPRVLSQDRKSNFHAFNSPARLYLCHYEIIRSEEQRLKLFLKTRRVGVILDESQKIKNPNSELAKSFFKLSPLFVRRIIMTGTPIANRPYDIWSQIFFLDGGKSLGNNFNLFKEEFDLVPELAQDVMKRSEFQERLSLLFSRISSFSVRETKQGAEIILPSKEIRNLYAPWETVQHEMYTSIRDEYRAIIIRDGIPTEDLAEGVLKRLLRLVQIASNPELVDKGYKRNPGKYDLLVELLDDIYHANEKAIVWTSFTENADWLNRQLRKYKAVKVHGKMSISDRNRSLEKFLTKQDIAVLVATPGAAKEGLTLTVANHVIFYDRSFSLDDYLQAQDRIHRISQRRTCYVYNILMENSIDDWVDILISEKKLAAQLGQGDITEAEYESLATFTVWDVLKSVLSIEEGDVTNVVDQG